MDDARQHPDTGTAAPHPPEGSLRPATTEANSGAPLHGLQDHLVDGQRPDATASLANAAKDEHAAALQKDIDVGDDYDVTGWLEGAVRLGELTMTDVRSMVSSVLANAGREAIDRLDIRAHGNGTGVQIGRDWVTTANFDRFRGQLESLRGHFSPRGFVHLRACEVGQDVDLLRQFAQAFRVPVYAGTGAQNNILGFNTGRYVMVRPNGTWSYTRRP